MNIYEDFLDHILRSLFSLDQILRTVSVFNPSQLLT